MPSTCTCKLAIVTGGSKGIGYAIVKALCERLDGDVYMTARDADRGRAAEQTGQLGMKSKFHQLDVTNDVSVAVFVANGYAGVNVLVNNAGIAFKEYSTEPFGVQAEETLRVNYFALRTVCGALFPLLVAGARVVNLSSSTGRLSMLPGEQLKRTLSSPLLTVDQLDESMHLFVDKAKSGVHEQYGWPSYAYCVSKVGVSALTFLQQRELDSDSSRVDMIVNCVHPGSVNTDMISHKNNKPLTAEQAAEAPVYLALLPAGERYVKGQYVWNDKTVKDWREY